MIKNETDYTAALARIDELLNAINNSPEAEELNTLTDLVILYEEKTEGKW